MGKETHRSPLERTLNRLLDRRTDADGHVILLDAALALGGARAASLWAFGPRGWNPLAASGEVEHLPEERRIRALLDDARPDSGLRAGERLLVPARIGLALALSGGDEEEGIDALEALLLVHASTLEPGRIEAPPLPRRNEPE